MIRLSRPALGSLFEIYVGGDTPEQLERVAQETLDRVDWAEQQLSHYLPTSDICQLNGRAYQEAVLVVPNLMTLLLRLRRWSEETQGAFDVTAGKLVREWGLFRQGQTHGEAEKLPDPETLTQIVQQIGWQNVQLDEIAGTVRFLSPSVELHLGAVGKGYIVQAAADYLRSTGVACGLLHCGNSSIVAFGSPPEAEGWTVGLPDPQVPTQQLATVTLHDYSLSTSGSLEQSVTIQGRRYSHLFDPRTGYPVEGPLSVSVLAPDAAEGDALATAFTLQGVDWTRAYCESHPDIGAIFLLSEAAETKVLCIGDRRILAWIE